MNPTTTPSLQVDGSNSGGPVNNENAAPPTSTNNQSDGKNITVFHDAENFNVKHPLQSKWTLWFTKPPTGRGDNWNDLLKEVVTFDSVEEFWGVYVWHNLTLSLHLAEFSRTTSAPPHNSFTNPTTTSSSTASAPSGKMRRTSTAANGHISSKTRKESTLTSCG